MNPVDAALSSSIILLEPDSGNRSITRVWFELPGGAKTTIGGIRW